MKIASFETKAVSIPREPGPLGEGPGAIMANFVTLKMRTDDGVEGVSYAGFTSAVMQKALKAALDALAAQTIGDDPMVTEAINEKLLRLGGGG